MPNFTRYYIPDSTIFITNVTHNRIHFLESEKNIELFWNTLREVQKINPFHLLAYVVFPDHFHWLMQVKDETGNFSKVMYQIKRNYTLNFKKLYGINSPFKLWQSRFWDHVIRDEIDLNTHFDYIHWNPVKHGFVLDPKDWIHSSLVFWIKRGYYPQGWGISKKPEGIERMDFE